MNKPVLCLTASFAFARSFGFAFFDGEFQDAEWNSNGVITHRDTGGNPGGYGYWQRVVMGTPGGFGLSRPDFVYTPSVSGALPNLSVALDGYDIYSENPQLLNSIAVFQGGHTYSHGFAPSPIWTRSHAENLTSLDFFGTFGTHPDFSSAGAPIVFGVFIYYFVDSPVQVTGGLDNFFVTNEPVPEPLSLSSVGVAILLMRRRRLPQAPRPSTSTNDEGPATEPRSPIAEEVRITLRRFR